MLLWLLMRLDGRLLALAAMAFLLATVLWG